MSKNDRMSLFSQIHYVNISALIKFSEKTSVFTLLSYVLHKIICFGCVLQSPWCLGVAIQIHIHNVSFYGETSKFFTLIPTPDFPHFYYILGGNLGSLLYGDFSVMYIGTCIHSFQATLLNRLRRFTSCLKIIDTFADKYILTS